MFSQNPVPVPENVKCFYSKMVKTLRSHTFSGAQQTQPTIYHIQSPVLPGNALRLLVVLTMYQEVSQLGVRVSGLFGDVGTVV